MVLLLVWRLFERLLCNKIVPTVVTRVEPHKEAQLLLSFLYFRFIACWFILFILHPHQRHPKLLQVVWPYKEGVSYLNVCYKNHNFIIISKHLFCAYIMEILMLCGKRCPIIALVFFFLLCGVSIMLCGDAWGWRRRLQCSTGRVDLYIDTINISGSNSSCFQCVQSISELVILTCLRTREVQVLQGEQARNKLL
jgi:hypothetical protein